METQGFNLFIVNSNKLLAADLQSYLKAKLRIGLKIFTFATGESCLEKIDKNTHIVVVDYFLDGKNGLETLRSIKKINPKTEVIILSSNEDIALAIETFRAGAKDYVIKGRGDSKKITKLIERILTKPVRIIATRFDMSRYMMLILSALLALGIISVFILYVMKWI